MAPAPTGPLLAVAVAVTLVAAPVTAGPVATAAGTGHGTPAPSAAGPTAVAGDSRPVDGAAGVALQRGRANNSTAPRHRNPEAVNRRGDIEATGEWLAGHLATRLGESAVRIDRGQYEAARSVVGDRFDSRLARLVEVSEATPATDDDRIAASLASARDRQREFTDAVAAYRETRRDYLAARRAGDESRARALARELERTARTVERTGSALADDYATLSNATGANLTAAVAGVNATRRNVTARQSTVRTETFVATRLDATAPTTAVSFGDPLPVVGHLRAANGTPVANRSVRLRVGERTLRTRTNETGGFRVRYRPTRLAANATAVRVRYRPRNTSVFLGNGTSLPVTVDRVTPDVSTTTAPSSVRFGERLSVGGTVTADGVGVPSVPVVVRVGGTRLARVVTAPNGSFATAVRLPVGVASGDRRVHATVSLSGRAVARANDSTTVAVRSTPPDLTAAIERRNGTETVAVTGRLTAAGRPVAGRPLAVRVDGTFVGTVTTDGDGGYVARLPPRFGPASPDRSVEVVVVHEAAGSNVGNATARASIRGVGDGDDEGIRLETVVALVTGRPALLVGGLLGLVLVGVALRRRRTSGGEAVEPGETPDGDAPDTPGEFAVARERLDGGDPADAVRLAYVAVREELTDDPDVSARTPREFREGTDVSDSAERDALRRVIDAYERAVFAPGVPDRATAADAVAAAEELLGE